MVAKLDAIRDAVEQRAKKKQNKNVTVEVKNCHKHFANVTQISLLSCALLSRCKRSTEIVDGRQEIYKTTQFHVNFAGHVEILMKEYTDISQ
jgi:hypothetical protein